MSGDYRAGLRRGRESQEGTGLQAFSLTDYYYYTALTVAALYENASGDEQQEWRELLTCTGSNCAWADSYPPTFGDKHALVSAEIARIEGGTPMQCACRTGYSIAREHGFVQNEGLA